MARSTEAASAALVLAGCAGAANSLQTFLNGRLAGDLGSAVLAATVNNGLALGALISAAAVTGVPKRLIRGVAAGVRPRWWHVVMATNGAAFVIISTALAPKVGIALLTVSVVCGQSSASLVLDGLGLNPSGRKPFNARRITGAGLAVVAVAIGAVGGQGHVEVGLLMLGVAGGVAFTLQQMSVGYITKSTGEPLAAAMVAVAMAGLVIVTFALASTGGSAPNGWSAPPMHWLGGLLGAIVVTIVARVVGALGALRLTLAVVAGQSIGALALDLAAPVRGNEITMLSVVSVLLTVAAAAVAFGGQRVARDATEAAL